MPIYLAKEADVLDEDGAVLSKRPAGLADGVTFHSVRLGETGWSVLRTPANLAPGQGVVVIGDKLDDNIAPARRTALANRLGFSLDSTRGASARTLLKHLLTDRADEGRWPGLSPTRIRTTSGGYRWQYEIHLGERALVWDGGEAPAPPADPISDTFDRADNTDLNASSGHAWQWLEALGEVSIVTNGVQPTATAANRFPTAESALSLDHYCECEVRINTTNGTGSRWACVMCRVITTFADGGFAFRHNWSSAGGNVLILSTISAGGSPTDLASIGGGTPDTDGRMMRLEAEGSTFRGYYMGVLQLTTTNTTKLGDRTGFGFRASGNNTQTRILGFEAGDLSVPVVETVKIKQGGTFVDKPINTKVGGTFVNKPHKVKRGGAFV